MKILLTGSTGYIGRRLLPVLVEAGHHVVCLVRDQRRFDWEDFTAEFLKNVTVAEADLNDKNTLTSLPKDIDLAYYLVHSMSSSNKDFTTLENRSAENFIKYINETNYCQLF